ncbi:MAG TPA: succinylglutamate desuccinylase/aspartoacylase family protein [Candidatus Limnocylindria bacterium]|nr:succinylglutamate desuccinylase/aspartoacylase family protein [Candidatus Limnocylindria bacterium]
MAEPSFTIGATDVAPGARQVVTLPVTTGLNGAALNLTVHVVHGARPGPTLALLSTLHGGEWFSILPLRRLVQEEDPAGLAGTLLVVPVANPPALGRLLRNAPDRTDSPDMNRVFPGPLAATNDQLAAVVTKEILARSSCLIDLHQGPWGAAFRDILIPDDAEPIAADHAERLALAFGSPIIRRAPVVKGFPGPRSSIGYAGGVLGIPAMGVEVGGAGFGAALEEGWIQATIDGIRAVMAELGMVRGPMPERPTRQLVYRKSHRVNPRVGGLLRSRFGGERLGEAIAAGTLLGEVLSPYTNEVIEELRAPADGLLFYTARDYPVEPGGWAFGIADTQEGARWVEA